MIEKKERRDGKPIETIGWYEKRGKIQNKDINMERFKFWVSKGATPSITVSKIAQSI